MNLTRTRRISFFLINCPKFKIDTNLSRDWCEIDFLCVNMVYTYCYCVISDILMDHMQITNLINFGLVLYSVFHKAVSTTSILISREYIYISKPQYSISIQKSHNSFHYSMLNISYIIMILVLIENLCSNYALNPNARSIAGINVRQSKRTQATK